MINPQTKANKLHYILKDSISEILITDYKFKGEYLKAIDGMSNLMTIIVNANSNFSNDALNTYSFNDAIQQNIDSTCYHSVIPNDLAALVYTSGSTGYPKGVMLTHMNMAFTTWSLIEYLKIDHTDKTLLVIPLAFDYGLYQLLMSTTVGSTLVALQSFTFPSTVYKAIEKYRPTVFPAVPTIFSFMITANQKSGLSFSIKKITNTAAALPSEYVPHLKNLFPNAQIYKMYGLTECKRVCYLEPELIDSKTSSVGKPIPGTEVFLLTPDGKPAKPHELGILYVRGSHVMLGYWNNEKLSNEMLKPSSLPYEQVLCTNDWFTMDNEGFLYFLNRNDDIIKTRGEKVSPREVENVIYNIPDIKEVVVIGIPNEIMGEEIVAVVTLDDDDEENMRKLIMRECSKNLESFMIPAHIEFLKTLPKCMNGKIDKKALSDIILEKLLSENISK